ncbi:zinc carboxypeptidase domain-containing protein [Phthorimaea operculella]|nr:zinc carboxypeptidase domain-containing protein [Phthorimaea operculella]
MFTIFLLFGAFLGVSAKNEEYMGHKVYNIKLETQAQADRLNELQRNVIDFWRKPSLKHGMVGRAMVPASHIDWFEERLNELNISKDVFIEDVYEHLKDTEKALTRTMRNDQNRTFDYNGYYRYDEILAHLNALQEVYANSTVNFTVEEYGTTANGLPLVYIKISNTTVPGYRSICYPYSEGEDMVVTTNDLEDKPVVIVESGIIPREWITIPAAMNIVNRILENPQFLDKADWIIVPIVNPDGYEYSHTNLRLWTKNRSIQSNLGIICPGVNINRNFDIGWGVSDSSSSPCSHLYAGVEAFSEIESQMIKHLIETYNEKIKLYVSLQNSGGFISYPWQYERAASGMFRQHLFLGLEMIEAMNDDYRLDVGWSALGDRASGTGSDFAQKNGVLYSLNIDVVQRGEDGVNIPEDEIVDVIEDVWRAVSVAANNVL